MKTLIVYVQVREGREAILGGTVLDSHRNPIEGPTLGMDPRMLIRYVVMNEGDLKIEYHDVG